MSNYSISVVIPTYNGAHKLPRILKALEKQTIRDFEIVIAVDGSTDDTMDYLSKLKGKDQLNVKYQENKGRSVIRNFGASNARGDLLIFYDDDVSPQKDSVERHLMFHRKHQTAICGGVPFEDPNTIFTDIQAYKSYLGYKWLSRYSNGLSQLFAKNVFLSAANFSIPKELFLQLNGFKESLSDAEDYDLAVRAINADVAVYLDKDNIAWHDDRITCRSYVRRLREYHKSHNQLHQKKNISLFRLFVYQLFSSPVWINIIDKYNFLKILPKALRFKVYDIITYSLSYVYPEKKI